MWGISTPRCWSLNHESLTRTCELTVMIHNLQLMYVFVHLSVLELQPWKNTLMKTHICIYCFYKLRFPNLCPFFLRVSFLIISWKKIAASLNYLDNTSLSLKDSNQTYKNYSAKLTFKYKCLQFMWIYIFKLTMHQNICLYVCLYMQRWMRRKK